jgi:hypothetical protein
MYTHQQRLSTFVYILSTVNKSTSIPNKFITAKFIFQQCRLRTAECNEQAIPLCSSESRLAINSLFSRSSFDILNMRGSVFAVIIDSISAECNEQAIPLHLNVQMLKKLK